MEEIGNLRSLRDWRAWLPAVLVAFVLGRVLLLLVVLVIEATLPLGFHRDVYSSTPVIGGLTGLDALYYLGIAAEGYHLGPVHGPYHDWVFFPAFPLLTRIASVLTGGDVALAGVLVANLAFLAGLVAVAILVRSSSGDEVARRTVLLTGLAPGAVAFGLAYSDSLLFATSAGALLAVRAHRWWAVAFLFAVAALSRPPGILLGIPIAAAILEGGGRRWSPAWLVLLAGPLAVLAFAGYQGVVLGDPLAFIHGQADWNIAPILGASETPASASASGSILPLVAVLLAILLAYTAMLPMLRRARIPWSQVLVAAVAFGSVFLSGRLQSDARYLAIAWPFAWFLATRTMRVREIVLLASGGLFVLLAFLNVTQVLAP